MNMRNLHLIFAAAGLACASVGYASNVQKSEQKKAPAAVDLRAALSFSENWEETPFPYGIYTAPLAEGSTPEFVFLTDDRNMEGGAVYVDGVIHSISKLGKWLWDEEDEGWYFNQTGAAYTSFDAETGEVLYDKTEGVSTDLFTSDMCYDHTTGNIYGVFKVNGYKNAWGILDIDNLQVEYLNQNMSSGMSAIAVDKEGQIWAKPTGF